MKLPNCLLADCGVLFVFQGITLKTDNDGRCVVARIMYGGMIHRQGAYLRASARSLVAEWRHASSLLLVIYLLLRLHPPPTPARY